MSIYIGITTLEDVDVLGTIATAFVNADNERDIYVGVAVAASDELLDKVKSLGYDRMIVEQFSTDMAMGIGQGRKLSRFAYSGEDHFLQIDSHTFFQKGWDTTVLSLFNEALDDTNNDKTVLSGALGSFTIENGRAIVIDDMCNYSVFTSTTYSPFVNWFKWPLSRFPNAEEYKNKRIVPANKINSQFVFGNRHFAEFDGLHDHVIYTEEEIIHSINLLEAGFSLAYPNVRLPLTHRDTLGYNVPRQDSKSLWSDPIIPECLLLQNMYDFIKYNREACERYDEYAKCDLLSGRVRPLYIPSDYTYFK